MWRNGTNATISTKQVGLAESPRKKWQKEVQNDVPAGLGARRRGAGVPHGPAEGQVRVGAAAQVPHGGRCPPVPDVALPEDDRERGEDAGLAV